MPKRPYAPKGKHLPDPFTHEKREQTGVGTSRHINELEKAMRGINPAIERSIPVELKHIRTEGSRRGTIPQLILHQEAEKLDELASRWTDHLVSGLKKAKLITSPSQEQQVWKEQFDKFIERRVRKLGIKHVDILIREIDSIVEYTRLPKIVHEQRLKDYAVRAKRVKTLLKDRVSPELNLIQTVKQTVHRKQLPPGQNHLSQTTLKAIDVCSAAGIYADLKLALSLETQQGVSWTRHFRNGMHLIWESELLPNNIAAAIKNLER